MGERFEQGQADLSKIEKGEEGKKLQKDVSGGLKMRKEAEYVGWSKTLENNLPSGGLATGLWVVACGRSCCWGRGGNRINVQQADIWASLSMPGLTHSRTA